MPGLGLIQPLHLVLILVIVMVVFGAGKLSQVGGALGQSVKEFKASIEDDTTGSAAEGGAKEGEAPAAAARATVALPTAPETRPGEPLRREEI